MSTVQAKLQAASTDFQKLQLDLANVIEARQRLEAQFSENELVKKVHQMLRTRTKPLMTAAQEFGSLTPENTVYKLIGPVLVKQDQLDAKANVETRLEFIKSEMYARLVLERVVG